MFFFANVTLIYNEKHVLFLTAIDLKFDLFYVFTKLWVINKFGVVFIILENLLENIAISVSRESVSINIV